MKACKANFSRGKCRKTTMGLLVFLFLYSSSHSFAATGLEAYSYRYAGKEIQAQVGEVNGVKVNDLCVAEQKKCLALKVYRGRSKFLSLKDIKQGNYAGAYCELMGGTQLFAAKNKEEAKQFCVFKDLTFIEAKALYEEHAKKAGAKK